MPFDFMTTVTIFLVGWNPGFVPRSLGSPPFKMGVISAVEGCSEEEMR